MRIALPVLGGIRGSTNAIRNTGSAPTARSRAAGRRSRGPTQGAAASPSPGASERRCSPRVDGGQRSRGVEIVGKPGANGGEQPVSCRRGRQRSGRPPGLESRWAVEMACVYSQSIGSDGRAARAGSPSGRRRRSQLRHEYQVAARLRHLLALVADHAGVHVGAAKGAEPVATSAVRRDISWCGKIRSLPPPCTTNGAPRVSSAIALHSMCQPGPAPADGCPRPAPPAVRRATAAGRGGSSCPADQGRRRARRRAGAWGRRRSAIRSRSRGGVDREVEVAVDVVGRRRRPGSADQGDTISGIDSTTPR